jgi:hypothetical protein
MIMIYLASNNQNVAFLSILIAQIAIKFLSDGQSQVTTVSQSVVVVVSVQGSE